jgi:uncharacterized secreted protein with C-terminal beta-propeller domain
MKIKTALVVLAALTTSAAVGCGGGGGSSLDGPAGKTRASLHRAKSCPDLLADLKGDAAYKVNKGIDQQIKAIQACLSKYGEDQCSGYGYAYATSGGAPERATADAAAAPSAPSTSGSFDASKTSATSYSQTNTQVKGVDEADIIKNDGKNIYVLHGRAFKVVNAWPSNTLAEVGTIDIEGSPTEMYVADGRVVVYSQVNGYKLFEAAGVKPKTHYQDFGYYAPNGGMAREADVASPYPYPNPDVQYAPLTKITVLKLDGTKPVPTREVYFEGNYLDSRRVGTNVRTVLQGYAYGPKLKYGVYELYTNVAAGSDPYPKTGSASIAALQQLRAENLATINASQLGDWLPYTFTKNGDAVNASTIACEDFYVPSIGSTQSGITEVASLDLSDGGGLRESAILGQAQTVYGSADTLYLAASAYIEPPFMWNDPVATSGDVAVSPPPTSGTGGTATQALRPLTEITAPDIIAWSQANTHVHKFEFASDARFPNYVASGTVPGSVKNQFSMDDKDGFLRIATTEQRQYVTTEGRYVSTEPTLRPNTLNHVFTLGVFGPWLDIKGELRDLAPGEQIYSVRFVGTRGYVVTFRQVDPLFVVDLADPLKPNLLAALKIPGFSDYMHPIDENHLLTIGRDATVEGRVRGLQLQIFDVTDGKNPILAQKYTYSSTEYGQTEATYDHKAFTFFAEKGLLAFPYYAYSTTGTFRSSLEVFKVDVATGFKKLGSIDHTSLLQSSPTGYCGGYYGPSVRRGVFLENIAYAISYGGIVAKDVNDLAAAGTQIAFPAPVANVTYGTPIACAL